MGKKCDSIIDAIGNTPLVKLSNFSKDLGFEIFAKCEFLNPTGSIKDRTAKYMIKKAEKEGKIKKGDTIIENSSGNMALSLAFVSIHLGYKLKVVVRDTISNEKLKMLYPLGAEVVFADTSLPPESEDSYNNLAKKLAKKNGYYYLDQHNNRDNNEAHYNSTAPEISEQTNGDFDYFIAGMGTGGTIGGVGKFLKEKKSKVKVIAVDIEGSIFYDYFKNKRLIKAKPYLLEGLGDEFLIGCADFSVIDEMVQVSDKESFSFNKKLIMTEGILAGGSSGAVIAGIYKMKNEIKKGSKVVTIFPDSAFRYLSTILDEKWLKSKGF
jgi:cystathionine beta-synthase